MLRKLALTGALTAALAASPLASQSVRAADAHDIIGGAIAIGILGAIIADQRDRHSSKQRVVIEDRPVQYEHDHRPHRQKRHHRKHRHEARRHVEYSQYDHFRGERRVSRSEWRQAKRECTRQRWTDQGWETYVSQRCLSNLGY